VSHLPGIALKTWRRGESLSAEALNTNFTAILGLIEVVMHAALSPDPAGVANEVKLAKHDDRLTALEHLTAMHARQRNEREVTPLAYTAAIMQQVRDLREPVEAAQNQLLAAHVAIKDKHEDLGRRLARIEQRPDAASQEDHDALFKEHQSIAQTLPMLLAQVSALRHEMGVVTKLATGHDRLANRLEFAPMSTMAHLLQRIMEIERRLEARP
jgi:hypothetical protein